LFSPFAFETQSFPSIKLFENEKVKIHSAILASLARLPQKVEQSLATLRPRKGIKISPQKRPIPLRYIYALFWGEILRVCFTSFSPKFQVKKTSFFLRKEAKKLYLQKKYLWK
jgi:hypothetical protein